MGGTCRVQGVGDVMKALPPCPDCWFTVVMPDYGVSTPEAFAAYDKVGSSTHPDCEAQEKAIRAGDLAGVCAAAGNALEECSGARDNEVIKTALKENGAVTALMTGSGAAVFGVLVSGVQVLTRIRSSSPASIFASASASCAAPSASSHVCMFFAMRRSRTPVRCTIHSSLVSTMCSSIALVRTKSGRHAPVPIS